MKREIGRNFTAFVIIVVPIIACSVAFNLWLGLPWWLTAIVTLIVLIPSTLGIRFGDKLNREMEQWRERERRK